MNDQQDVVLWHLYLTPQGEECVLASRYRLDALDDPNWGYTEEDRKMALARTMVWAPSFEAFLYRFWQENTIWYSLHQGKPPLTETQRRYLAHYEQKPEAERFWMNQPAAQKQKPFQPGRWSCNPGKYHRDQR